MKSCRTGLFGAAVLALGLFSTSSSAIVVEPTELAPNAFGAEFIPPLPAAPGPDTFPIIFGGGKSVGVPGTATFFLGLAFEIPSLVPTTGPGAIEISVDLTEDGTSLGLVSTLTEFEEPGAPGVLLATVDFDPPGGAGVNINDVHISCSAGPIGGISGITTDCVGTVSLVGFFISSEDADLELRMTTAAPEPGGLALAAGALLLAGGLSRRKHRA